MFVVVFVTQLTQHVLYSKAKKQLPIKRCKHFELGYVLSVMTRIAIEFRTNARCSGDRKQKGQALVF
jgi:hypothetical protein